MDSGETSEETKESARTSQSQTTASRGSRKASKLTPKSNDEASKAKSGEEEGEDEDERTFSESYPDTKDEENIGEEEESLVFGLYGPGYEEITMRHLKEIAYELSLIQLSWPKEDLPRISERKHYPNTYCENSPKEKLVLLYAENFRRQFHFIYPDRRPLLLAPDNECGLQKMICTTIRPTKLHHTELGSWQGIAKFVADHLEYEPLDKPTLFPDVVMSPATVLAEQRGNCFEFSIVMCSFLLGVGYDAYVVSGYATLELCSGDQTRIICDDLKKYKPEEKPPAVQASSKYKMNLNKEFESAYLLEMQRREEEEAAIKEFNESSGDESEDPMGKKISELPADELFAVRVHSWVLIRPGRLGVKEPIFIDGCSGKPYSQDDPNFLGLESLWNDTNYWVNLQDCSEGCKNLKFELKDPKCWNWLLLAEPWHMRGAVAEEDEETKAAAIEEEEEDTDDGERKRLKEFLVEKHLDMPGPWSAKLEITDVVYKRRFPNGRKKAVFCKAEVNNFAPYVQRDGLVKRIVTYTDFSYEERDEVYEVYENRADCLTDVIQNFQNELVIEKFDRGREDGLKEHAYYLGETSVEGRRKLKFFSPARPDNLAEMEMDPLFFSVVYENRPDFLHSRYAKFAPRLQKGGDEKRTVLSLVEKYHRNPLKKSENDIAERTYYPQNNRIFLKYHYGEGKLIASTREFVKPPPEKLGDKLVFTPEDTVGFSVDPTAIEPKPHELFLLLKEQLAAEEQAFFDLRTLEDELSRLLKQRTIEIVVPKLVASVYDTERNEKAKQELLEKEKKMKDQIDKEYEEEVDFLSPYIARLGIKILIRRDAQIVHDQCLTDYKNLLVARANSLQEAFERTSTALRAKHHWFETHEGLTKEQEEEYFEQCNQLRFYLHTLEIRLKRHRDLAPIRYQYLENWLRNDPRLAILFVN